MSASRWVSTLGACWLALAVAGCGAIHPLSKEDQDRASVMQTKIERAQGMEAMDCAPMELARARALLDHARHEAREFHSAEEVDQEFRSADVAANTLLEKTEGCWQAKQKRAGAIPAGDADRDGVPDYKDRCADTPAGTRVDVVGCPLDTDGDGVADRADTCPKTPRNAPVDGAGCPRDSDADGLSDWDETQRFHTDPSLADTDSDGLSDGEEANVRGTDPLNADTDGGSVGDGLEVLVAGTDPRDPADDGKELKCVELQINFDFDKDEVRPEYHTEVERIARYLEEYEALQVVVQGHTDNVGTPSYNMDLSLRRARNVARLLTEKYGVANSRVRWEGYGAREPVVPNDTEENRARNRRIYAVLECR